MAGDILGGGGRRAGWAMDYLDCGAMIEPRHLLEQIIRPVLKDLKLWSEPAERLLLGTACQESECGRWLVQLGDVPNGGLGIYQMEEKTWEDIEMNFLFHRPALSMKIRGYMMIEFLGGAEEMISNLCYATAMTRVHYLRDPQPIPETLPGQAAYWKRTYNSVTGKGTVQQYIHSWNRFVTPDILG